MGYNTNQNHETLLSWIDTTSYEQRSWIYQYCINKGISTIEGTTESFGGDLYVLKNKFRNYLHNPATREMLRRMRAAWHQKTYREKNGKQVSFQLPERTVKKLDKLAQDRGQSRTKTLDEIVHTSSQKSQRESIKSRNKIKKLEENLKKLRQDKLDSEKARNEIIRELSEKLIKEVKQKCIYEEAVGPLSESEIEGSKESDFQERFIDAIYQIDKDIQGMKLLRSAVKPLSSLIDL